MLPKRGPYAYFFLAHFQTSYEDTFPLQTVPPGWVTGSPPLTPPNTRKNKKVKDGNAKKNSRIPGLRPPLGRAHMWQSQGFPNELGAESESQTSMKVWELTKLQNTQSLRVSDSSEILVYKEVKKMNMGLPAGLRKIPLRAATPTSTLVETSTVSSVSGVEEQWMVNSQDTSLSPQHPKLTAVPLSRKETPPGTPHKKPTTPQSCIPSPKLPEFIKQFVDHDWCKELFPELKTRHTLRPKDFAQLLLKHMECVEAETKMQMLKALWGLHQQGALEISEEICTGLIDVLKSSTSSATASEKHFLTQLLSTLVSLDSASQKLVVELLAFLVHGELQDTAQYLLEAMGVKEVDLWLRPEVEFWDTGLAGNLEPQEVLRKKAADWLELWTYQYKVRNRTSFPQNLRVKDLFTPVDVLNYFCSQRRGRQKPQPSSCPPVQTETKLLSSPNYRLQPVYCLGERLTSEQKPHTKGVILPPLLSRHPPTSFPPFISLPLPHVSTGHFPFAFSYSEDWRPLVGTRQHYFFLERSFVDNYR
nr:uncharacterized protein LOC111850178 isoform X2 [Paramormyrops kingsleyae]